jgi:hypothetical protein
MLPLSAGPLPGVTLTFRSEKAQRIQVEWRRASRVESQTPDVLLAETGIDIPAGTSTPTVTLDGVLPEDEYAYLVLRTSEEVDVALSDQRATGILRLDFHGEQRKGDSHQDHLPAEEAGCEAFEMWFPERRPAGKNLAITLDRPLSGFGAEEVSSIWTRPTTRPNAWVADPSDPAAALTLRWERPETLRRVTVFLDPDWDHPLESVILKHPERVMPCLAKSLELRTASGEVVGKVTDNRHAVVVFTFTEGLTTDELCLHITEMNGPWPAAVFGVRGYGG